MTSTVLAIRVTSGTVMCNTMLCVYNVFFLLFPQIYIVYNVFFLLFPLDHGVEAKGKASSVQNISVNS